MLTIYGFEGGVHAEIAVNASISVPDRQNKE